MDNRERLTCRHDRRALLVGRQGEEVVFTHGGIAQSKGFVLIHLGIHLAGEIAEKTVEGEERWIGDQGAETHLAGAMDGGRVALAYRQRNVPDDADRHCDTVGHSPLVHQSGSDENQVNIHCQVTRHDLQAELLPTSS